MNKKWTAFLMAAVTALTAAVTPVAAMADTVTSVVSLGADLSDSQKSTVLNLLEVKSSDLTSSNTVTVTNAEEHQYLDGKIASSYIGTRALSSCKVTETKSGSGIKVTTHNINYVTDKMYENALVTAGMSDADVIVAAPTSISGTAALVGAMKAYAVISGDTVSATEIDTATDELVTTSQIASETGDSDKTTQLVAAVKQVVAEKNYTSESDITKVIKDVANQLGITLSDEEVQALADVMQKIAALNLDPDKLTEQVKSVYEAAAANGLDLSKYGITNDDVNGFFSKLSSVFRAVIDWIKGLTS
ncbi:MAG: DUF1002 domain-containing protein [Eubacteriales bacterium]|nr:DUF1002 domain-containing protein [Lachnospiraceae bacterium]MDD5859226.1 DUF1002 domain-containing protein [Eubacteriales bacterium]MCH4063463.1 DUF1002 domain-containing protein [Lachnospiraceae bacterium]MCH4104612.1 DUF1002 domain-containing protein [Lachnospiraceae bacterium]MCI1309509.1 DUF1002 domain-containing protein [Lachnospiraceae bacterium]